jgi:hypothetical protein
LSADLFQISQQRQALAVICQPMKERFTSNYYEFLEEIKIELTSVASIDKETHPIVVFLQFSELPIDRFAIHYLKGKSNRIILKQWNSQYDNERFGLGVYNLDRIAIYESIVELTEFQAGELDTLLIHEHSIKDFKEIILDGYRFKLTINQNSEIKSFEWIDESQLSDATKEIVGILKRVAGI